MPPPALIRQATSLFEGLFAKRPAAAASAPGHLVLLGVPGDEQGGPTLALAIDRRTAVVAGPGPAWEAVSARDGVVDRFDPDAPDQGTWTDRLARVVRGLRSAGIRHPGARLAVAGHPGLEGGYGGRTSLSVAAARALGRLARQRLPEPALVAIECGAEAGHPSHLAWSDGIVAVMARRGWALRVDPAREVAEGVRFEGKLWIAQVAAPHDLTQVLGDRRRQAEDALTILRSSGLGPERLADLEPGRLPGALPLLPPPLVPSVRFAVAEAQRVRAAADSVMAGDWAAAGRLLTESHRSFSRDYAVNCGDADLLVESALTRGAYGARVIEVGTVVGVAMLIPAEGETRVLADVAEDHRRAFGRLPGFWSTRAAGGARSESIGG